MRNNNKNKYFNIRRKNTTKLEEQKKEREKERDEWPRHKRVLFCEALLRGPEPRALAVRPWAGAGRKVAIRRVRGI